MRVCAITGPLCGQHGGRSALGGGGINPRSSGQFAGSAPRMPTEAVVTPAAAGIDSSDTGWLVALLSPEPLPGGNSSLATDSSYTARLACALSRPVFFFAEDFDA